MISQSFLLSLYFEKNLKNPSSSTGTEQKLSKAKNQRTTKAHLFGYYGDPPFFSYIYLRGTELTGTQTTDSGVTPRMSVNSQPA